MEYDSEYRIHGGQQLEIAIVMLEGGEICARTSLKKSAQICKIMQEVCSNMYSEQNEFFLHESVVIFLTDENKNISTTDGIYSACPSQSTSPIVGAKHR